MLRFYSFDQPSEDKILACDFGAREVNPTDTIELTSGTFTPFYSQSCVPGKPMQEVGHAAIVGQLVSPMTGQRGGSGRSQSPAASGAQTVVQQVGADKALERLLRAGAENLVL